MTQPAADLDHLPVSAWACESPEGCDHPATVMVWCDHHIQGCNYTGFRCDVHRNLLVQEVQREISMIRRGWILVCDGCDQEYGGLNVSDHLRWIVL